MEIPCKFYPHERSTTSSTVWYLERLSGYHQIFNSRKSSSASTDYRDRTSLVPGNNSCSLRIDPVRRDDGGDEYYPGIAEDEDTNAWKQEKMTLGLRVTGKHFFMGVVGRLPMAAKFRVWDCRLPYVILIFYICKLFGFEHNIL